MKKSKDDCPHRFNKKLFKLLRTISKREGQVKVYKCINCGKVVEED
jgi:DNA-directed RNA polymerase subunit M/transcription elongation factor TFIIS